VDIQQIIKDRYKELPADIQEAIKSTDLAAKFAKISEKHSLHIDQSGALQTETILVMLGLESSDDFVENVKKGLEVSRDEAVALAKDVNTEILDSIRNSLRILQSQEESEPTENVSINPPAPQPIAPTPVILATPSAPTPSSPTIPNPAITSVEKAGDFTVIQHPESSSEQYKEGNIDKEAMLKHIENDHVPLVDHLLTTPVSSPQVVEEKNTEVQKPEEKKAYTMDPYKEQIS